MTPNRRQFVAGLLALLPVAGACAGRALASRPPRALISGTVVGKGLRFGPARKSLYHVPMPGCVVHLMDAHSNVIARDRTDDAGHFTFRQVPYGEYFVRVIGGDTKLVIVDEEIEYVGWFQRYNTR